MVSVPSETFFVIENLEIDQLSSFSQSQLRPILPYLTYLVRIIVRSSRFKFKMDERGRQSRNVFLVYTVEVLFVVVNCLPWFRTEYMQGATAQGGRSSCMWDIGDIGQNRGENATIAVF